MVEYNPYTRSLKAARVEAEHARTALYEALPNLSGSAYAEEAARYVLAGKVVSEAWARERAGVLNPQSGSAEATLGQATASLKGLLSEIRDERATLDKLTTVLNILLGAILLFGL